jgi:hypothetical protein
VAQRFEHFADFWLFYLSRHRSGLSRGLHCVGVSAAAAYLIGAAVLEHAELAAVGVGSAYALAWLGHLAEGSLPTTFKRPLWSIQATLLMYGRILTGRLGYDEMLADRKYPRPRTEPPSPSRPEPTPAAEPTAEPESPTEPEPTPVRKRASRRKPRGRAARRGW